MPTRNPQWFPLLLLAAAAGLFLVNLGGYDLWPPDEPRFGEIAREMMQSGDPLVLRVNDELYKEKPPLLFWSIAAASLPRGEVTAFTARIPSVLAALVTVFFTFLLGRRLYGSATGAWSAVVLMTSALFWWEARSVRTDMLLTAFTTVMLYALWSWHADRARRHLVLFYAALLFALLTKGPPALVFPLLLLVFFYRKRPGERRQAISWLGLVLAVLPVLAWYVYVNAFAGVPSAAQEGGVGAGLFRQTIGRFFLGVSKAEWPWYYFTNVVPSGLLPWTLFLPWTILWTWRRRRDGDAMRFLLSWVVPAFLFFTICIGKRPVYILPLFPAFAVLIARSLQDLAEGDRVRWRRNTAYVWGGALVVMGAAPFVILLTEYRDTWSIGFAVFAVLAAAFAVHTLVGAVRSDCRVLPKWVFAHFYILLSAAALVLMPALDQHKSARPFLAPLRDLSRTDADYRLYSVGFSREEYVFYAEKFHTPVLTDLLALDLSEKLSVEESAKLQRRVKRALMDAVEDVPVVDIAAAAPEEVAALRAAVDQAVAEVDVDHAQAAAFEKALREAVERFTAEFESGGPAYFFVQEEDWRWLVALHPHLRDLTVTNVANIGSRRVLLVANLPGVGLLGQSRNAT